MDVNESEDPEGLRVFYYLVQDLKALVFSLISLHFKVSLPARVSSCVQSLSSLATDQANLNLPCGQYRKWQLHGNFYGTVHDCIASMVFPQSRALTNPFYFDHSKNYLVGVQERKPCRDMLSRLQGDYRPMNGRCEVEMVAIASKAHRPSPANGADSRMDRDRRDRVLRMSSLECQVTITHLITYLLLCPAAPRHIDICCLLAPSRPIGSFLRFHVLFVIIFLVSTQCRLPVTTLFMIRRRPLSPWIHEAHTRAHQRRRGSLK